MTAPARIAMCSNPRGTHEHVPLDPDEPMPTTCFADCDCTPVEFVRAVQLAGAVSALDALRRAADAFDATLSSTVDGPERDAMRAASAIASRIGGQ